MADELNSLLRVTKKDIKPAAETLAKAFRDYPMSAFFIPDAEKRAKKQPGIFRMVLKSVIATGEIYATSPEMEGVAVWTLVDKRQPSPGRGFSIGKWRASLFTDKETRKRQQAFFDYSHGVRERLMPERFWYLQILGVHPSQQGNHFSSRLLKPMLERIDKEGLPVFLETQLKKNVALYEHFGFKVMEEGTMPGSSVYSWAMVREGRRTNCHSDGGRYEYFKNTH